MKKLITQHTSSQHAPLYPKLERHLEKMGYKEPWSKYKIFMDIDPNQRQKNNPNSFLILGLHAGIEPVEDLVFLLHRRIFGSRVFLISYDGVSLDDRMKSHETTNCPFLWEKMAAYTFSIHTMPNNWLEKKIAIGGLPKKTPLKLKLKETLMECVPVNDVIVANGENGFREKLVEGSKNTNPVNYTSLNEGVQIEFPEGVLKTCLYTEKIVEAVIKAIEAVSGL